MVEQRTTRSFASKFLILAGATALLAFASAGCAAGVEGDETDLDQAPALQPQTEADCGPFNFGTVTCSNPVGEFVYSTPGCGESTRLQALNGCNTFCNVPCVDSGWGS